MTSAFLIQNELMPRKVFDASRMASRQASSNPFGDCAMTSIFRTIAIGLSSHSILPEPNTSVRKRALLRLVSHRMRRLEGTPARRGGAGFTPDSPDEMAVGHLRAPILAVRSSSYAESGYRVVTDPTGERRNRQFRQRFHGLQSCRFNPSGESGFTRVDANHEAIPGEK